MVVKVLNWSARGRIQPVTHSILPGRNAARAQGLLSVLGLPLAGQDGSSLPKLGQGHEGECGQGEVLKLHLQDAK